MRAGKCVLPFGCRGQCLFPGYGHCGAVSVRPAVTGATVSDAGHGKSLAQRCLTCTKDPETVHLFSLQCGFTQS